jgi:ferredoxin-type protein NapH
MADSLKAGLAGRTPPRSWSRALLLTLPIVLWTLLMSMRGLMQPGRALQLASALTAAFMIAMFFMMMKTASTYQWRRWFFVALGLLFPIGFIHNVMALRGSMGIPIEEMIAGRTPFCYLPIPLLILPAALTKTLVFPGSLLPRGGITGGMAAMAGLWLAITLVVGKGWCSYACFFGGIEEGMAALPKKAQWKKLDPRLRLVPWAVLLAMVLLSLALFEPTYCLWLCPFKAVSEYVAARNAVGMVQNGIFVVLFAALVIVLPLLTKKRTQCTFLCPFGAFQSIFNKTSIFDIKIDRTVCSPCVLCQKSCPTMSLNDESIKKGETLMSCMKCGACVDVCPKGAAVWHIKGTQVAVKPERARLMFLYAAWATAAMFGGSIITEGLTTILQRVI